MFHLLEVELQQQLQMLREDNNLKSQDKKYPLWKYVTREAGLGNKMKGGGNVAWKCSYCHKHFMSTYYHVKVHLLALPSCGISACTQVSLAKRKEMERKAFAGVANVVAKTKNNKNDDPLPFLRKSSNKFPFESSDHGLYHFLVSICKYRPTHTRIGL